MTTKELFREEEGAASRVARSAGLPGESEAGRSLYSSVKDRLYRAADIMRLDPDILKILESTTNEIVVHFPVRIDDGRVEIFTGYRVQHNNVRGAG